MTAGRMPGVEGRLRAMFTGRILYGSGRVFASTCIKFQEMETAAQLKPSLDRTAKRASRMTAARTMRTTVPGSILLPSQDSHLFPLVE